VLPSTHANALLWLTCGKDHMDLQATFKRAPRSLEQEHGALELGEVRLVDGQEARALTIGRERLNGTVAEYQFACLVENRNAPGQ
jgi:hypothetical protein